MFTMYYTSVFINGFMDWYKGKLSAAGKQDKLFFQNFISAVTSSSFDVRFLSTYIKLLHDNDLDQLTYSFYTDIPKYFDGIKKGEEETCGKAAEELEKIMKAVGVPAPEDYRPKTIGRPLTAINKVLPSETEEWFSLCAETAKYAGARSSFGKNRETLLPIVTGLLINYIERAFSSLWLFSSYYDDSRSPFNDDTNDLRTDDYYDFLTREDIGFDKETSSEFEKIYSQKELGKSLRKLLDEDLGILRKGLSEEDMEKLIVLTLLFCYDTKEPDNCARLYIRYFRYLGFKNSHRHIILRQFVFTALKTGDPNIAHVMMNCFIMDSGIAELRPGSAKNIAEARLIEQERKRRAVINRIAKKMKEHIREVTVREAAKRSHEINRLRMLLKSYEELPADLNKDLRDQWRRQIDELAEDPFVPLGDPAFAGIEWQAREDIRRYKHEVFDRLGTDEPAVEKNFADDVLESIDTELITSAIAFDCLKTVADNSGASTVLDYSTAIVPMMKALEILLNVMYDRIDTAELQNSLKEDVKKYYFNEKNGSRRYSLTLGGLYSLFCRENMDRPDITDHVPDINDWWNGNEKVFAVSSLKKFSSVSLPIKGKVGYKKVCFSDSDDLENARLLGNSLRYISAAYRNPGSHDTVLDQTAYELCKDLFVSGQKLLWILMALIQPDPSNP